MSKEMIKKHEEISNLNFIIESELSKIKSHILDIFSERILLENK